MSYFASDIHFIFELQLQVERYFPGAIFHLEVNIDPESGARNLHFIVRHPSYVSADIAHDQMETFDNEWFLDNQDRVEDLIVLSTFTDTPKEDKLLEILNKMIKVFDPIKFDDLNVDFTVTDQEGLFALEKKYREVRLKYKNNAKNTELCSSIAALIATITDILVGKRLAFQIDDNGIIVGFQWYEKN